MLTWSTNELADIFMMGRTAIRGWIRTGKLRGVKTCNQEGYLVTVDSLFDFFKKYPVYQEIFVFKLNHECTIGNKDSKEVLNYLQKKGYLT